MVKSGRTSRPDIHSRPLPNRLQTMENGYVLEEVARETPIVLLDDILSELDAIRSKSLDSLD